MNSNRESAKRSRRRKQEYLVDLETQVRLTNSLLDDLYQRVMF